MQDKNQIEAEIQAVKLQLGIANTAIETAPEADKEKWRLKRFTLEQRLEELERERSAAQASPSFDDATADAMLNEILSAQEPAPQSSIDDAIADAMLNEILSAQEPAPQSSFDDATADAMLNEILSAQEPAPQPSIDDATADAMLNEILSAKEPEQATSVGASDAMLNEILSAHATPQQITGQEEPSHATDDILTAPESVPPVTAQEEKKPTTDDVSVAHEPPQAAPAQDNASVDEMIDEILSKEPARPVVPESVVEAALKDILSAVQPEKPAQAEEAFSAAKAGDALQPEQSAVSQEPLGFDDRLAALRGTIADEGDALDRLAALKAEAEGLKTEADELLKRAKQRLKEAEEMKEEAAHIKLEAETDRAMYAAEAELQRGLRHEEAIRRDKNDQEERERLAEKIARRKAEISAIRNGIQNVKDAESAFVLREKLFSVQVVLDEDERNSPEITYLLTKSQDDVNHALEVADLKQRLSNLQAKPPVRKHKTTIIKKKAPPKKKKAVAKKRPAARPAYAARPAMRSPARHRPSPRSYR